MNTQGTRLLERALVVVLALAVLDCVYLSWRFLALKADLVVVGTGLCSWTAGIDCDQVLSTPEARAFFVPNAILGFGFFFGSFVWWTAGARILGDAYRHHLARTLAFWLGVATLFTFRFWWLLLHLDHFCPFCPWNHLLTYVAFGLAVALWRRTPAPTTHAPAGPLALHVVVCAGQLFVWLGLWWAALEAGLLRP
jgi:uncharacterized membrane protein